MKTLPLYADLDVVQDFTVATVVDELGNVETVLEVFKFYRENNRSD